MARVCVGKSDRGVERIDKIAVGVVARERNVGESYCAAKLQLVVAGPGRAEYVEYVTCLFVGDGAQRGVGACGKASKVHFHENVASFTNGTSTRVCSCLLY